MEFHMDKFGVWNRNIYGAHIVVCPNVPACLDEKNMQVSGTEIWKTLLIEHHSILPVKSNDLFCAWKCAAVIQGCKMSKFFRCNPQMD
jgi:hypothetical protein